jgi:transcriptional regulator with XRE-family HTH domain
MIALNFQLTGIGLGHQLHEQLSNRRRKLGLSLDRVATRARLSRATIASLERGGGSVGSLLRLLAAIAPKARRRAEERAYWGAGDKEDRDSRVTPADFMEPIYTAFGQVDLDPCGHPLSPVIACRRIIAGEGGDGLADDWSGRVRKPAVLGFAPVAAARTRTVVERQCRDLEHRGRYLPAAGSRPFSQLEREGTVDALFADDCRTRNDT